MNFVIFEDSRDTSKPDRFRVAITIDNGTIFIPEASNGVAAKPVTREKAEALQKALGEELRRNVREATAILKKELGL